MYQKGYYLHHIKGHFVFNSKEITEITIQDTELLLKLKFLKFGFIQRKK